MNVRSILINVLSFKITRLACIEENGHTRREYIEKTCGQFMPVHWTPSLDMKLGDDEAPAIVICQSTTVLSKKIIQLSRKSSLEATSSVTICQDEREVQVQLDHKLPHSNLGER